MVRRMLFVILILSYCQQWAVSQYILTGLCQIKCVCIQNQDKMVVCNLADELTAIPTNVPTTFFRLSIQNSKLYSPIIYRRNMTGLEHLSFLKIIYCHLEAVESMAFADMRNLEYLDLSHNKLKIIQSYTFSGLNLKNLHLMENPGLKILSNSFRNLKVKEINLRSNSIKDLSSSDFIGLDLEKLYLFNNSLKTLDPDLAKIFDKPGYLVDVSKNPLHCDCNLQWLAKNLRQQPSEITKYVNITCRTPSSLYMRSLTTLTDQELNCPKPYIQSLSIDFSTTLTQLDCLAVSSFREAEISWTYEENGQQKEFKKLPKLSGFFNNNIKNNNGEKSESKVSVNVSIPPNEKRSFTCSTWIKDSEPQKVTVVIRTPKLSHIPVYSKEPEKPKSSDSVQSTALEDGNYLFRKQFTILEMIGAVVGTFTITIFLLLLIVHFIKIYRYKLMKTAALKPYISNNHGQESMYSQPISHNGEYDIPRVCETHTFPPPPSFDHIEFLDFKSHNKFYPTGS